MWWEGHVSRGKRESSWLVIRRCLAIIRRAQRGPASREALIQAVLSEEGADAYGEAREKGLENDLRHVRQSLLVDLYYNRQQGGYVIKDTWMPFLDLPDDELETIAWLEETFGPASPQHDEVHALLGRLRFYLAPERRAVVERFRTALTMDLGRRDEDEIEAAVWRGSRKAYLERRQLALFYLSPQYDDGEARRHVVEAYEPCYFDAKRGHYYLRAYCRRMEGPEGCEHPNAYLTYRLGRIISLSVLPQKLPPTPPSSPRYVVEYELSPNVARLGVTHHPEIKIQEIERREDGGVLVRGETEGIFWAVRTLLHYGPNCRVLGGPEMVREMRAVVQALAALYEG
jgi:predicted DNA-binding transcriptional regulator YafY